MEPIRPDSPFPTAREDARVAEAAPPSPQTASDSYRLAFADMDFLLRDELRPVRLHLELLKPELALEEAGIVSTVVVFGSTRTPEPALAREALARAEEALARDPDNVAARADVVRAQRLVARSRYYEEARRFARLASEAGRQIGPGKLVVVTGGGPGIMEAANRGADDVGAESVGLNIVVPFEQVPNRYITPKLTFQFHYFAIRKMHFLLRARALVCFPGGYGTMDELFETLTLIQTGKIKPFPVLLFGRDWWSRIINFEAMVEEEVISPDDLQIFRFVETAEEAWAVIEQWDPPSGW